MFSKKTICVILVLLQVFQLNCADTNTIVVDAGSSGTRVQIIEKRNDVYTTKSCGKSSTLLLANFIKATVTAEDFNAQIGKLAEECTAEQKLYDINAILLLSTAGSRDEVNAIQDATARNGYSANLDSLKVGMVTEFTKTFGTMQADVPISISVISGRYEGLYGLLALNIELGIGKPMIQKICLASDQKDQKNCLDKVLFYEVGGSSCQVAFTESKGISLIKKALKGKVLNAKENIEEKGAKDKKKMRFIKKGLIDLPDALHHIASRVYSRSFLGNGKNALKTQVTGKNPTCFVTSHRGTTEKHLAANLSPEEKVQGKKYFEDCLAALNKIDNDRTLAHEAYGPQFDVIKHEFAKLAKNKIVFNSGSTYFPYATLSGEKKDVYQFKNMDAYLAKVRDGGYCALKSNDAKQLDICIGLVIPVYFAQKLGTTAPNQEFFIINNSWTAGAVYLGENISDQSFAAQPFVAEKTNENENQHLKITRRRRFARKNLTHRLK